MTARTLTWLIAAVVGVLTVAGTVLWIVGIARPAPVVAAGRVVSEVYRAPRLSLVVAVGGGAASLDRAGATVAALARGTARGVLVGGQPLTLIAVDFRDGANRRLMRLAFDPGVIAAGAVSGATADHLLGLAGEGSIWPRATDPAAHDYCGRFETMTKPFCAHILGTAG